MRDMKSRYGAKEGERVFYATKNKRKKKRKKKRSAARDALVREFVSNHK